jgi:hypothetical protein
LTAGADAGDTTVEVASNDGFAVGDEVEVGEGTDHAETAVVTGFGSLLLDRPLQFDHAVDELVTNLGPAPTAPTAAPTGVTATPSGASGAQVTFTPVADASDGGSALTGHAAECSASGQPAGTASGGPSATSITVPGLAAGVTYGCTVHATNGVGDGPDSSPAASVKVGVPGPPGNVQNKPGGPKKSIKVTWSAAAANGGPVQKYHVTCAAPGSTAKAKAGGSAAKLVLKKLKKSKTYTCSVRAKNAFGLSASTSAPTGTKPKR